MQTLVYRPGDPQALKIVATANAANVSLDVAQLDDDKNWRKLVADDSSAPFAAREIFLILPDGSTISEPNAIASYIGKYNYCSNTGMLQCLNLESRKSDIV